MDCPDQAAGLYVSIATVLFNGTTTQAADIAKY